MSSQVVTKPHKVAFLCEEYAKKWRDELIRENMGKNLVIIVIMISVQIPF